MIRATYQVVRVFTVMSVGAALLGVAGCQEAASQASLDTVVQSLMPFVGDFARQVLAAYLF